MQPCFSSWYKGCVKEQHIQRNLQLHFPTRFHSIFVLCIIMAALCCSVVLFMHMMNNSAKWILTNFTEKERIFYMSCSICICSYSMHVLAHLHSKSYFHTQKSMPTVQYQLHCFCRGKKWLSICTVFLRYLNTRFLTSCPWWEVTYELRWVAGENPLQCGM